MAAEPDADKRTEVWPLDPKGLVFILRAIAAHGRDKILTGIVDGKIPMGARLVDSDDGRCRHLPAWKLTPEGWGHAIDAGQIIMPDQRPDVPRRRMPKPHWLFANKIHLERFALAAVPTVPGTAADEAVIDNHILPNVEPTRVAAATKARARQKKPDAIAHFLRDRFPTDTSLTYKELLEIIKTEAPDIGKVSTSSLTRALKLVSFAGKARQS